MSTGSRVAIVTGGALGLGRAMVLGLLQHGVSVVAVDRNDAALNELLTAAGTHRAHLAAVHEDLTSSAAEDRVRSAALAAFGRIDILVNNAGMGQSVIWPDHWVKPLRFWNVELDQWTRFFELNTHVTFRMCRMVAPLMMEQKWGRIVNITTSLGSMLRAGFGPYGASKAAAESLSAVMAAELEGTGVTVNVLTPGGLTNTAANPGAPFDRSQMLQPGILVTPLVWLISDDAADVNGRRFIASRWDASLPAREAAQKAGAPAGWPVGDSRPKEPQRLA
jgi:NAD(P)-dependent dehydrogenase (short-subunit alcohol dehydrogenase family)